MAEFYFSDKAYQRVLRFFETQLRFVEGKRAGQLFQLEQWQKDVLRDLFGWLREDGSRRYRIAYLEIPRKSGKSTLCAGIALYLLLCDGEERPQVYSCAGDRSQASIVFQAAREMIERGTAELQSAAQLRQYKILNTRKGGWYEATSAEGYSAHGKSPHGIIFDELHTQPNRILWDAMLSGRGARHNPLVVAITTAGYDRSSICWEMHQRALKAMADPDSDPYFYGRIWGAAEDDDWTSEDVWRKANPNLGVSVSIDFLREECEAAKANPAHENVFRNLYLNQWTQQAVRWIPMSDWDACKADFRVDDLIGLPCWAAIDLASTRDVNALSLVFRRDDEFVVAPFFWIPETPNSARARQDAQTVRNFAQQGHVKTTPGNVTDYGIVCRDVLDICDRYRVQALGYDPWGPGPALMQQLQASGMPVEMQIEFGQGFGSFAAPCKQFERILASRKLRHDGNPVLRWMAQNVSVKTDPAGNLKPDKSTSADKIDGIVATIMAIGLAMREEYHGPSVYENRGMVIL